MIIDKTKVPDDMSFIGRDNLEHLDEILFFICWVYQAHILF